MMTKDDELAYVDNLLKKGATAGTADALALTVLRKMVEKRRTAEGKVAQATKALRAAEDSLQHARGEQDCAVEMVLELERERRRQAEPEVSADSTGNLKTDPAPDTIGPKGSVQ